MNRAEAIISAIADKRCIEFTYDGLNRVVEPHTFGIDGSREPVICGYQTRGGSRSGQTEGWKSFHVGRISMLHILAETFVQPRPQYRRDDGAFIEVTSQL